MVRRRALLLIAVGALGCATAPVVAPPRGPARAVDFFPMRAGMAWSYDTETGIGGDTVLNVLAVEGVDGDAFVVRSGSRRERYERRPEGVLREGEYILREPLRVGASWEASGGGRVEVRSVEASRTVNGQVYREVVEVHRSSPRSRIETTTWYARDVGAIEILGETVSSIGGRLRVRSTLRGYTRGDDAESTR
ncbi:MAG: hypothetical protein IPN17_26455 [Deltaproteobacteria bacterium]|jgi:hypothetical protein|nr:hypothetical protein [Deltaproteobacteria bacterium]MBK8695716.1 hypothetical protein [Deltaproteobacteria bacterium]MBP6830097.1 hypothetical protein [Deltaproteobacteria bacterium]